VEVELVTVPPRALRAALAGELEHADLREPLRDQVIAAEVPGAGDDARQLIVERDVERGLSAGRDRAGQVDAEHAAIGRRPAVGWT
jgi:hypothetical protein